MLDNGLKILEVLKWPLMVFTLVIILVAWFKESAIALINRIKSAGPVNFDPAQSQGVTTSAATTATTIAPATRSADELIRGLDSGLLREIEDGFQTQTQGMSDAERIRALSRLLAASFWGFLATNTYRLIFGSQIEALRFLNSRGQIPKNSLEPFYAAAAQRHPNFYQNYSYDQWVGFMEQQVLLRNDGGNIGITTRGQEFLQFLLQEHLSEVKAG